jgi:type II secretory pathway predicted ATPase ExeA
MYEGFFHLRKRPFAAAPHADCFIPSASSEHARQTLLRCVDRGEGPALLVGPSGTGKSLLCLLLARHFETRLRVAHLSTSRLATRRDLLQNMLFGLKLPYRGLDEGELRLSLLDRLEIDDAFQAGALVIVDEAHSLPLRLLEELRLVTNLVRDGLPRVRLVLAGGPMLEERFTHPKLESFNQRLAGRCYLHPLNREETFEYVRQQVLRVGGQPNQIFADEALQTIYRATDGIPRLINQVCDHALLLAHLGGKKPVPAAGIEEAWADLQQLPLPWGEASAIESSENPEASAIEVGELRDEPSSSIEFGELELGDDWNATVPSATWIARSEAESQPQVELAFSHHDIFGGDFHEEEVILDRNAALAAAASPVAVPEVELPPARKPHVARPEVAKPLAAKLPSLQITPPEAFDDEAPSFNIVASAEATLSSVIDTLQAEFNPADDPVMPEEPATLPASPKDPQPVQAATLADLPGDDRDILVIETDRRGEMERHGPPRRRNYRQLFSTLRKR